MTCACALSWLLASTVARGYGPRLYEAPFFRQRPLRAQARAPAPAPARSRAHAHAHAYAYAYTYAHVHAPGTTQLDILRRQHVSVQTGSKAPGPGKHVL